MFKKITAALATTAALVAATPAMAKGDNEGKIQFKLLGTAVLPDAEITEVELDNIGLPADAQTRANDNVVPTVAVEYFLTDNISLETIAGITQHDVDGRGGIAGLETVSDAIILPATLTAKYHFTGLGAVKPYVGAGPTYFIFIDEEPGADLAALGATRQQLNDKVGVALQAGVDIALNDNGIGFSIDAKRYFVNTTATWFDAGGDQLLRTRHAIDPWVLSAGLALRF